MTRTAAVALVVALGSIAHAERVPPDMRWARLPRIEIQFDDFGVYQDGTLGTRDTVFHFEEMQRRVRRTRTYRGDVTTYRGSRRGGTHFAARWEGETLVRLSGMVSATDENFRRLRVRLRLRDVISTRVEPVE